MKTIFLACLCFLSVGTLPACNKKTDAGDTVSVQQGPPPLEGWTLVWNDEFDSGEIPSPDRWSYDVGGNGWGNNELEYYTQYRKENARVENGALIIEARKENFEGMKYTSARLVTTNKGDWLYGRAEIRAKLPDGYGTWPAIWMLSTDWAYGGWPQSGEIDIMEHVG
jgi:beta-glucanase (GH16 family)